jgi:23S rRNA pseudouridine1911/1915/1917 synthase
MEPNIIFEDEYIAVVSKPAGMVVNRAETTKDMVTLTDWAEQKFKIQKSKIKNEEDRDFVERAGIVHRLDKDTSGLVIIAKDPVSFSNLQAQFKSGNVQKTYIALAHGKVTPEEGEINVPVGRLPWDRTKFGVIPMGRESRTVYKVLEYKKLDLGKRVEELAIVELYPKTGRTHQIRVHLRYLGFPIFGDALYAGRKNFKSDKQYLKRHFLHAKKIQFLHPKTNEKIYVTSPLPPELVELLSVLQ